MKKINHAKIPVEFKLSLRMRFTILLLIISVFRISANSYSQNTKISLDLKEVSISTVLQEIENRTDFFVYYRDSQIDLSRKVTIKVKKKQIDKILEYLFLETDVTYKVVDKSIILQDSKKEKTISKGKGVKLFDVKPIQEQIEISGTVTDVDNQPLPGVNVIVIGTDNGTQTDFDGKFNIEVAKGDKLQFSFLGKKTIFVTVGDIAVINVLMQDDASSLDEVVVTALGIKREKKALGYAVSEIGSDELMVAPANDLSRNLYGKVSGLQISTNSGGNTGGVKLNIRGTNSLTGNNRPLIIMDGIPIYDNDSQYAGRNNVDRGSGISDINPDDIESLTVLKGGSAAALYGSQAANGVILITTKRGARSSGLGVTYTGSFLMDDVVIYEDLQNEFGGQLTDDGTGKLIYTETPWSFGPRMEGQMVQWWDGEMRPYSPQPDNMKDIYQSGYTSSHNIVVQNGNENGSYRLGYTRQDYKGTTRGSEQAKNSFSLSVNYDIADKLFIDASVNYYNIKNTNPPIRTDRLVDWGFARSARMDLIRQHTVTDDGYLYTPELNSANVNGNIRNNLALPLFWNMTQNDWSLDTDRVVASSTIGYKIIDDLTFRFRVGSDFRTFNQERKNPNRYEGSTSGSYYENTLEFNRKDYFEGLLTFNKEINDDFNLMINAGASYNHNIDNSVRSWTNRGLVIPYWYSISNSVETPRTRNTKGSDKLYAIFGTAQVSYKNMLFLDLTGRNDWSSILPEETRSYFYPSISSSFVFSDAFELPEFVNFGKVRVSWAQVGAPGRRYYANSNYSYGNFNGVTTNSFSSTVPPLGLESELQTSIEAGLDFNLFENRLGIGFTYFHNTNENQIMGLNIAQSTGGNKITVNAGELRNRGIEIDIHAAPIRTDNFSWDIGVQMANIKNEVVSLASGIERLKVGGGWGVDIFAQEGRPYGEFWLRKWKRVDGKRVIASNGLYVQDDEPSAVGSAPAKAYGGISNILRYKRWDLNIQVDYSLGGKMGTLTNVRALGMGRIKESLFGRDEKTGGLPYYIENGERIQLDSHSASAPPSSDDGTVYHDGIIADGVSEILDSGGQPTGQYEDNNTIVSAESYYRGNYAGGFGFAVEEAIRDNNYFKLREMALRYNMPTDLAEKMGMTNLTLSVIGRNLFYIYKSIPNIDPESAMGTTSFGYLEHTPYPSTRSFGLSVIASF